MLRYDKDKNILYGYKSEIARPPLEVPQKDSVVYKSFLRYKDELCKDDIMTVFLPELLKRIGITQDRMWFEPQYIVPKTFPSGYFHDTDWALTTKFRMYGYQPEDAQDVTIMKIPNVLPNGIIEHEGKEYAFIHMMEQESTMSYEANANNGKPAALKIKNPKRSIQILDDASKLKITFSDRSNKSSKTKYQLLALIGAMAHFEGYNIDDLWNEFANFTIVNCFKDEQQKDFTLLYSAPDGDYHKELVPRLTLTRIDYSGKGDDSYDNTDIRDVLNNTLCLDRAVGEVLAKDVESVLYPGQILAKAGSTIHANHIEVFEAHGVYKVYIKHIPNIEGYYLKERIFFNSAPAGLKITDELRGYFPEEKGMYLSRDYEKLPLPIIFDEGELLTYEMVKIIAMLGKDSIIVTDKRTGGKKYILNFFEEIISNRQFRGSNIGKPNAWYYLDKDLQFVENTGAYTTYDLMALQSFCTKLFEGKWIGLITNSDAGFRKRLVPLHEQFKRAFAFACKEGFSQMSRKLRTIYTSERDKYNYRDKVDNEFFPFSKNFWRYLRDQAKCIVPLTGDNLHNPIAYQSACTKVNVYTANKHSVADSQREIAIGSYGKIDACEIPQSGKMGTVYNSTCEVEITEDGRMLSAYYEVKHDSNSNRSKIDFDHIHYFSSVEEEQYTIADIGSLDFDDNGFIADNSKMVLCRTPAYDSVEKQTFAQKKIRDVRFVNVSANQPLSWASACIPFMSSNDSARAIFAVGQAKQTKGLVFAEEPVVMTSAYEQFVWLNNKFGIVARYDGVVEDCSFDVNTQKMLLNIKYDHQDGINTGESFELDEYFDSHYSVTKLKCLVKPGQRFKKGDMLVSSNFISDRGILTFGVNALVGFHCDGYNYEDGAHNSTALCNRLTSYRINKEEFLESPKKAKSYRVVRKQMSRWVSNHYGEFEVGYIDKDSALRVHQKRKLKKAYGFIEKCNPITKEGTTVRHGVTVECVSVDAFKEGDKSTNRHGNKGVMSTVDPAIVDPSRMPRLKNGMALEVCLNPLGVGSRMNIGQINEIHCGLFAHVLHFQLSSDPFNPISEEEISSLMSFTVDLMNSTGDPTPVYNKYSNLIDFGGKEFFDHCTENIDSIRNFAGCFNKRGTTKLMLPYNDGKYTETEVLIGWIYISKLIQESASKIHARGGELMGEPYGEVTNAPVHGSSHGGGQRFGTMEMNAIGAYGVSAYAQELTNERSDNGIARNNFYVDTYLPPKLRDKYRIEGKGQRRSTTELLYRMLALGVMSEPEDGEFLELSYKNGEQLGRWTPKALKDAKLTYSKPATESSDSTENESDSGDFQNVLLRAASAGSTSISPDTSVEDDMELLRSLVK